MKMKWRHSSIGVEHKLMSKTLNGSDKVIIRYTFVQKYFISLNLSLFEVSFL